ncbi:MAG TPA: glycoside hydrolase family 2 TIM barrel-domain containing protein, partial [Isosphaeraceae bacterium]|nr:glycoside hydrolase family 2 TIM barrel-domain containing protein [Isosphaeraceae bacterium]
IDLELAGLGEGKYTITARGADPSVQPASTTCQGPVERHEQAPKGSLVAHASLDLDVRQPKLWTPESPNLYDLSLELKGPDEQVDSIKTYFGLRSIGRGRWGDAPFERVLLNGRPIYLLGALDQSFNPEGIYTAPSDAFLKRDIELAKSFGLNFLRIHIKPDEPRRLYWADKLGMMIMEDMPNTWEQNSRARQAWELTMREVVARDRNHPAIFSWVAFNETWGLGRPAAYKADKDTQKWVSEMVGAIHQLDPTRLVEDNSPCNYDHVDTTDLNSWHFYIDDYMEARRHIDSVVARTEPGSAFNYCPGLAQSTAPLINSEFGSVSAGGGDRDVSWGFRDLVTQLRRHPKIQGYIYTELSDIEWEHNGFVNYDRTPKQFGYEAFVPEMKVADLQGPDFIGYDSPPAVVAKPGETVRVPLFVSHYSDRNQAPKLRWWVSGYDGDGSEVKIPARVRDVEWKQYGVTELKPVGFQITPGPFVGALGLSLEDSSGQRIAANFMNVVIQTEKPQPRVQWRGQRSVSLRFAPAEFARQHWSGAVGTPEGKAYGRGVGFFEYRLKLPKLVAM